LPRKYRPPAARRRKSKKQGPIFVEPLPQSGEAPALSDDGAGAFEDTENERAVSVATAEPAPPAARATERSPATATKHIAKDYSYVRAEVRRIVLVAGILIASLVITAILRS
jgi:hypothetical protein